MHHVVLPSDLRAAHCVEFARALAAELTRQGQSADVQYSPTLTGAPFLSPGDICWAPLPLATRSFQRCKGVRYVLVQGERIPSDTATSHDSRANLKRLKKLFHLYDWYFECQLERMEYMRARGFRVAGYLPQAYHPLFDRRGDFEKLFPEPEWDVVFVGTVGKRRYACLQQLAKYFHVYPHTIGVGDEYFRLLFQGKVILNIHADELPTMEGWRITTALSNRRFVVSETIDRLSPYRAGEHLVMAELSAFPDVIGHYLNLPEERGKIAQAGYDFVRSDFRVSTFVEKALAVLEEDTKKGGPSPIARSRRILPW